MDYQKTLISCAIALTLGTSMAASQALTVTSWTLTDFDGDGLKSDIAIGETESPTTLSPTGNSAYSFGAGDEFCGDTRCVDITFNAGAIGIDTFTTGFNFVDSIFAPMVFGTISATIDETLASLGDGQALQLSAIDLGSIWTSPSGAIHWQFAPDHLINCTGQPAGAAGSTCGTSSAAYVAQYPFLSNPIGYNVEISDLTNGDYGVVIRYVGTDPVFDGFKSAQAGWRLEGIMHTVVPVPAAAWLFSSGLLGLVGVTRRRKSVSLSKVYG